MPLERQATFLHGRLAKYLQNLQGIDKDTLLRYKRLALHFIINKVDPGKLDELKF